MSDAIDILTAKVERLQKQLTEERQRREQELADTRCLVDAWRNDHDATKSQLKAERQRREEVERERDEWNSAHATQLRETTTLIAERDALRSQLATARADTVRRIRTEFDKQFRAEVGEYLSRAEIHAILDGEGA